jgi:hypothetical protein
MINVDFTPSSAPNYVVVLGVLVRATVVISHVLLAAIIITCLRCRCEASQHDGIESLIELNH